MKIITLMPLSFVALLSCAFAFNPLPPRYYKLNLDNRTEHAIDVSFYDQRSVLPDPVKLTLTAVANSTTSGYIEVRGYRNHPHDIPRSTPINLYAYAETDGHSRIHNPVQCQLTWHVDQGVSLEQAEMGYAHLQVKGHDRYGDYYELVWDKCPGKIVPASGAHQINP